MKHVKILIAVAAVSLLPEALAASPATGDRPERKEVIRTGRGGLMRKASRRLLVRPARIDPAAFLGQDTDGDGVSNGQDPCWFSHGDAAGGFVQLLPGCTALDILQMPDSLSGKLTASLEEAVEAAPGLGGGADLVGNLMGVRPLADQAVASMRAGDPCAAQSSFGQAAAALSGLTDDLLTQITEGYDSLGEPSDVEDDVRPEEGALARLEYLMALVTKAGEGASDLEQGAGAACAVAVPGLQTSGVIAGVDDSLGRMELTDGRVFALPSGPGTDPLGAGQEVEISGLDLSDGTGMAMLITLKKSAQIWGGVFFSCAALRVAPVQPFPPVSWGPFILHDPIAYRYPSPFPGSTSVFKLEAGARLAVENGCGGEGGFQLSGPRYSVGMHMSFTRKSTGTPGSWWVYSQAPGDMPVKLPVDVDPTQPATLTVTHKVASCSVGPGQSISCGPLQVLGDVEYTLQLVARDSMCTASYQRQLFDVDDRIRGSLRRARLLNISSPASGDGGVRPVFVAEGYGVTTTNPPLSTYPGRATIIGSMLFAIHSHDIYPIFGGLDDNENRQLYQATGVDHAAGLVWPRAVGIRNGRAYRYSCSLPGVVRDVVDFCPGKITDSYYHMPWDRGTPGWTQSQGNFSQPGCMPPGCPTHANAYAYDMLQDCGGEIRAARAGRVIFVRENRDRQTARWCCGAQGGSCTGCTQLCCSLISPGCPANEVWIRHQDGTIGRYVHMPKNGVVHQEGNVVRRGQVIATVGLTGNTSDSHLHIETFSDGQPTHLALFQALDPADAMTPAPTILRCYEPQPDDPLFSNNRLCDGCVPQ